MCVSKVEERVKEEDEVDTRRGKVIKFGWIEGVLMRCVALPKSGEEFHMDDVARLCLGVF